MARYTGPKNRLARKIGQDLELKTKVVKLDRRLQIPPGQHGPKGRSRKISDFGIQLAEKQKVKYTYGVLEKQFRRYFEKAAKDPKATGVKLLQLLELRLDNLLYRLSFAPTRAAARQFVTHGHVLVNGKKNSIPSYQVRIGDIITITEKIAQNPVVKELSQNKNAKIPAWIERKALVGKIIREPEREEIDAGINEQLIVEYYSR
ncbi:30S ribosomal protein S4 [Candidatus Beckwithbacteria bacterium]|nr:30S ribosomal protein S4 [Candidatus Beckwithbacteria bacterium]